MNGWVAFFLVGMLVGAFITIIGAWLSIWIERRKSDKEYEAAHDRFLQAQVDYLLAHQPTDEELKQMFSNISGCTKDEEYRNMFKS